MKRSKTRGPSAKAGESKPGDRMKDKATVRYLGYKALDDGGRGFDFSVALIGEEAKVITIEASADLFRGPGRIAIQEGAGICYETLRSRIETDPTMPAQALRLNVADVARHRKATKPVGRSYWMTGKWKRVRVATTQRPAGWSFWCGSLKTTAPTDLGQTNLLPNNIDERIDWPPKFPLWHTSKDE
jgi:hypothetical protein